MNYSKKCGNCEAVFTFTQEEIEPLSQTEQLLCAKEDLDFADMVKVTCAKCGTPSLTLRKHLLEKSNSEMSAENQDTTERLLSLAQKTGDLSSTVFGNPGPMFNEVRKVIIERWLDNFAANLKAAAVALSTGLDVKGVAISLRQVLDGVLRMCAEYEKVILRLEQVCGLPVRKQFEIIMTEARGICSGPTDQMIVGLQKQETEGDAGSHSVRLFARLPGFVAYKSYLWPNACVCCLGPSNSNKEMACDIDGILVESGLAKLGRYGNTEVALDPSSKKYYVSFRIPYCSNCKKHERWRSASNFGLGCGYALISFFLIGGVIVAFFDKLAPGVAGRLAWPVGVGTVLILAGYLSRKVASKARKAECCRPRGRLMSMGRSGRDFDWLVNEQGLGWIEFGQFEYGEAFAALNGLRLKPVRKDKLKEAEEQRDEGASNPS